MKMKIEINLDGAAFEDCLASELVTVFETIRLRVENFAVIELHNAPLFDSNGNKCGIIKLSKGK